MSDVVIDIQSDEVLCGKTTIAAIIKTALEAHGFPDVTVSQQDEDLHYKLDEGGVNAAEVEALLRKKPPRVTIKDQNHRLSHPGTFFVTSESPRYPQTPIPLSEDLTFLLAA